ncbi:MAG: hypothetical protein LBO65_02205 [Spirochaetaceae bacterium]|jgi:hypothetical protein|nr:hypothetical protein [Spirochaetaceae bacterium]
MKKLVLLAALILAAGLAFAQEEAAAPSEGKPEVFDLEINVGFPIHWTNAEHGDDPAPLYEDKTVSANTALGLALLFNFGRKVGLTLDADFFFGGKIAGFASNESNYNSLFGTNVLLGPVVYIYNGNFLRIPLAIGAHLYYFSDDLWVPDVSGAGGQWIKRQDLQVGPGVYLGIQFHFNNNIYIFSRTNLAIDIFRWHKTKGIFASATTDDSDTDLEFIFAWEVKPVIGIGVKF